MNKRWPYFCHLSKYSGYSLSLKISQCFRKELNLAFLSVVFDNYKLGQLKTATFREMQDEAEKGLKHHHF